MLVALVRLVVPCVLALGLALLGLSACGPGSVSSSSDEPGSEAPLASEVASPYRGTLVFQSDRDGQWDIYRIEADGSRFLRLTDHPAADRNPAWSPDGRWIAFSSERTGAGDIYLMDAEGGRLRRLTDDPTYEGAPRFSPDGRSIVFDGERDGRSEIYLLDVASGAVERVTHSMTRKLGPVFSPDGERLAYMEQGLLRWQVTLLDRASRETEVVASGGGNCRPAFSRDGGILAFVSTEGSSKADVWFREMVGARAGRAWRVATRPNAHNYDPAFSPDETAIAIASTIDRGETEQWDLFILDWNGRNAVRLTGEEGNERFPDWRPEVGMESVDAERQLGNTETSANEPSEEPGRP